MDLQQLRLNWSWPGTCEISGLVKVKFQENLITEHFDCNTLYWLEPEVNFVSFGNEVSPICPADRDVVQLIYFTLTALPALPFFRVLFSHFMFLLLLQKKSSLLVRHWFSVYIWLKRYGENKQHAGSTSFPRTSWSDWNEIASHTKQINSFLNKKKVRSI